MSDQRAVSIYTCIVIPADYVFLTYNSFCFVAQLTEDFCGVEPVTHPPIEIETRPPPLIDEEKLRKAYNEVDSVLLGCK